MAQQDAMEQVKEVLRQLIKYRFWIAVGVAALFGVIAYSVGAGPVREQTKKEVAAIKSAETDVKQYNSPNIPTKDYQPIVEEKTQVLTKDVNAAWKTLYARQAPLLTWPETVQERFRKWGRQWPETEDAGKVTLAQVDYIAAYKDYVDMVYKTFKPFDYETGEGIVVAAPKEALLRPAVFSDEHVPGLGKIWSAQERLWIQRTLFEVVAQVNKNATSWDNAIIREIETLEVGNPVAQDQRSVAKNEELTEAASILAPGETEPDESGGAAGGAGAMGAMGGAIGERMRGMMGGMGGMGGRGGVGNQDSQSVYYVKSGNELQYKILPVMMSVLIDQDHVQDFLVELENSPMSIEVKDFELQRPVARVTKPEKGAAGPGGFGGGMMPGGGMMSMRRGMAGYGGMMGAMQGQMMMQMRGAMTSQMSSMARRGEMMGGMGPMGGMGAGTERKGKDVRSEKRAEKRKENEEALKKSTGPTLFDPYFDIVQVTVYGQARFFNAPPEEPAAEPSPGEATAAAESTPTAGGAAAPDAKITSEGTAEKAAAPASATESAPKGADAPAAAKATAPDAAKASAPDAAKGNGPDAAKASAPDAAKGNGPDAAKASAPPDASKTAPAGKASTP
jgi:hypothetical protein